MKFRSFFIGVVAAASIAFPLAPRPARAQEAFVSDFFQNAVKRYAAATGAFLDAFVPGGSGGLNGPLGLAFGPDGNLYVCNNASNAVTRYDGVTGAFLGTFIGAAGGLDVPDGIAFAPNGDLFVSNFNSKKVQRFSGVTGALLGDFVTTGQGNAPFETAGLQIGPDGKLYVANWTFGRIETYDSASGAYLGTLTGNRGQLFSSSNVIFRPAAPEPASFALFAVAGIAALFFQRSEGLRQKPKRVAVNQDV